jgi:ankyrin repeat protein
VLLFRLITVFLVIHTNALDFLVFVTNHVVTCHGQADVNTCTETGQTALHYAASKNHLNVARVLIEANADLDSKDNIGETPLHRAAARDKYAALFSLSCVPLFCRP